MVIDCRLVWERIYDYLHGTLDGEWLAVIRLHLENCDICSAVLDSTRNIVALTADERIYQLPLGFSERLHARLDRELSGMGPRAEPHP